MPMSSDSDCEFKLVLFTVRSLFTVGRAMSHNTSTYAVFFRQVWELDLDFLSRLERTLQIIHTPKEGLSDLSVEMVSIRISVRPLCFDP